MSNGSATMTDLVALPEDVREHKFEGRNAMMKAFGGRLLGAGLASKLVPLPDGRLLVLTTVDNTIGLVLDLERREATRLTVPDTPEWSWLRGAYTALFDGERLVIANMSEVAIIETALVEREH